MKENLDIITGLLDEYIDSSGGYGVIKKIPNKVKRVLIMRSRIAQIQLYIKRRSALHILQRKSIPDVEKEKIENFLKTSEKLVIDMAVIIAYCKL